MDSDATRLSRLQLQVGELRTEARQLRLAVYLLLIGVSLLGPALQLPGSGLSGDRSRSLSLRQSWVAYLTDGADAISGVDDDSRAGAIGLALTQVGLTVVLVAAVLGVLLGFTILARPTGRTTSTIVAIVAVAMVVGAALAAFGVFLTPPHGSEQAAKPGLALLGTIGAGIWLFIGCRERD